MPRIHVYLRDDDDDLVEQLAARARAEGRSTSAQIRYYLRRALDEDAARARDDAEAIRGRRYLRR